MTHPRVGAVGTVLALALTACPASPPGPRPTEPLPDGPRGGRITIAYPAEPPTLDPFTRAGVSPATRDLVRLVMPSLFSWSADAPEPWLIEGDPEPDADPPTRVTFALRGGAAWSDGRPIGVRDLRRTWRIARGRSLSTPVYRRIESIDPFDDGRIRVSFDRPVARWAELFSAGLGIVPAHVLAGDEDALDHTWPVSGGPFVLQRWRRGLDMLFVRNERAPVVEPLLDRIRVVFVPDATSALELLRRGEVDALGPYGAPDWAERLAAEDLTLSSVLGTSWVRMELDGERAPLGVRAVRRALAESIDLERIVRGLVQEDGTTFAGVTGDRIGDARARLQRAGWRGSPVRTREGVELRFTLAVAAEDELATIVANAVRFQAERAGIRAELVPLSTARLWGSWLSSDEMRAAVLLSRAPPPASTDDTVLPLYRAAITLAARAGVGISAAGGPDGAFAAAHAWYLEG